MNGYSKLIIEDVEHILYFGRQATEEFSRRTETNMINRVNNGMHMMVDMIYAGVYNHHTKLDLPSPSYSEIYELVEKLLDQEDGMAQYDEAQKVFWSTKYGKDYNEKILETKKKVEQEIQKLQEVTEALEPTPNTGTT